MLSPLFKKAEAPSVDTVRIRDEVVAFVKGFSLETTPTTADKIENFADLVAPGAHVAVTFLPGSDWQDTVRTAARLRAEGMRPVPHVAARSLTSEAMLDEYLGRLAGEAQVDEVLVIGGAVDNPLGPYSDSLQVLKSGLLQKHGIRRAGIAGHPEGTPDIPADKVAEFLLAKQALHAAGELDLHIVTQFCFEAEPITRWEQRLRADGVTMPIHIGIPGLATFKTLINYARACGVGPSMHYLTRQTKNVAKLLTLSQPDELLIDLARYQAETPDSLVSQAHFYPLGGVKRAALWAAEVAGGRFTVNRKGNGFTLETPVA